MKLHSLLAVGVVALALALTGCTSGTGEPAGSTAGPSVTATGTPAPSGSEDVDASSPAASPAPSSTAVSASPSPSETATIPTECRAVVPAEKYETIFGDTPLNDPNMVDPAFVGAVEPVESYQGAPAEQVLSAATRLRCEWRNPEADITGLSLEVAEADPAVAAVYLDEREIAGEYTCEPVHGGRRCQLIGQNEMYPVEQGQTLFTRENIFIRVSQWNYPTDDLLGDVVDAIWN